MAEKKSFLSVESRMWLRCCYFYEILLLITFLSKTLALNHLIDDNSLNVYFHENAQNIHGFLTSMTFSELWYWALFWIIWIIIVFIITQIIDYKTKFISLKTFFYSMFLFWCALVYPCFLLRWHVFISYI